MKRNLLLLVMLMSLMSPATFGQQPTERTWTYTYLKAQKNEKENLKAFLVANWFSMDSTAVAQGLFNDYRLFENSSDDDSREWDFMVAVEYFTRGTYEDIEERWQTIRKGHTKVLIDGKDFPDLGRVVRSEELFESIDN